jgi:hypothetical protein
MCQKVLSGGLYYRRNNDMSDEIFLPMPMGSVYRNIDKNSEVVLLYEDTWSYNTRPDAENMVESVIFIDDDYSIVSYPKSLWAEEYEPVIATVTLFNEA